jgi:hypothetical protein
MCLGAGMCCSYDGIVVTPGDIDFAGKDCELVALGELGEGKVFWLFNWHMLSRMKAVKLAVPREYTIEIYKRICDVILCYL